MARPERFELPTFWFVASGQISQVIGLQSHPNFLGAIRAQPRLVGTRTALINQRPPTDESEVFLALLVLGTCNAESRNDGSEIIVLRCAGAGLSAELRIYRAEGLEQPEFAEIEVRIRERSLSKAIRSRPARILVVAALNVGRPSMKSMGGTRQSGKVWLAVVRQAVSAKARLGREHFDHAPRRSSTL